MFPQAKIIVIKIKKNKIINFLIWLSKFNVEIKVLEDDLVFQLKAETKKKKEMNKNNQFEFNKKSKILLLGNAKYADRFNINDCNLEDSKKKNIRRKNILVKKKISVFLFIIILKLNSEKKIVIKAV